MVTQLPDEDQVSQTKKQLLAKLNVLMGGKAAEELIEGVEEVSTGASSDLEQATKLARAMVTKYAALCQKDPIEMPPLVFGSCMHALTTVYLHVTRACTGMA